MVVFWARVVEFGQMWLYSDKSCCIQAKVVVFGKFGCIPAKWFYLGKVVVFWQKWLYSGKTGCVPAKWMYSGKVVVFGSKCLYPGKLVVFRQSGCIRARSL